MKKCLFLIFAILGVKQSIGQDACLSMGNLLKDVTDLSKQIAIPNSRVRYPNFDFNEFKPIGGKLDSNKYYVVGYDINKNIVEIEHKHGQLDSWNFKMKIAENSALRLMTYSDERSKGRFNSFYFVQFKSSKNTFLINGKPQFGKAPTASDHFDSFDSGNLNTISSVMVINNNFFPKYNFRISEGVIVLSSEMHYGEDNELINESVFFFNVPGYNRMNKLTTKTCLNELVVKYFMEGDGFMISAKPKINPSYLKVPIWINGGVYEYE